MPTLRFVQPEPQRFGPDDPVSADLLAVCPIVPAISVKEFRHKLGWSQSTYYAKKRSTIYHDQLLRILYPMHQKALLASIS